MRTFNYSKIKEEKWDSEVLGLIAAIYRYAGKQELYLRQRPDELDKLVEIAKIDLLDSVETAVPWTVGIIIVVYTHAIVVDIYIYELTAQIYLD